MLVGDCRSFFGVNRGFGAREGWMSAVARVHPARSGARSQASAPGNYLGLAPLQTESLRVSRASPNEAVCTRSGGHRSTRRAAVGVPRQGPPVSSFSAGRAAAIERTESGCDEPLSGLTEPKAAAAARAA